MNMSASKRKDVREILNDNKMGRYQGLILLLCFAVIALDGIDVVVMGLVAPQILSEWSITPDQLAPVLSAALFGLAGGALISGPLADRFGRKPVLLISVFCFGLFTLLTAFSTDITSLIILRFLTGLGAGAAAPNAATLASEYAPDRRKQFAVTGVYAGFSLGAAAAGFLAAWMIPAFGWRSMLILGGVLPLLCVIVLYFKLPESIPYILKKAHGQTAIKRELKLLYPNQSYEELTLYFEDSQVNKQSGLSIILSKKYIHGTLMLWTSYFMSLFLIYLCSSWLPTIVKLKDFSISEASTVASFFQMGGPIGCLVLGWCMDRFYPRIVLFTVMLLGMMATYFLGDFGDNIITMCLFAMILGFSFNGGSVGLSALASKFYPTEARATGISWMNGIGRFGAILSAFAGAWMISSGMSFNFMFTLLMIPAFIAGFSVLIQGIKFKN